MVQVVMSFLILTLFFCLYACTSAVGTLDVLNDTVEISLPDLFGLNDAVRHKHFSFAHNLLDHEVNGGSSCTIDHGCPFSSMVWASGTFTIDELLTPSSLLVASNMTLKLSLCCGYKYHGALLRNEDLYDTFLHVLLQASPFQVLSKKEKRNMFPRERAIIIDTVNHRRYDATYLLTAEDMQQSNDGDGDVIVLISGAVGEGARRIPLHHTTERLITAKPADVQLKIANVALKCKCPHTLLVMPVLQLRPDTLASVSIVGLGPHCGRHAAASATPADFGKRPTNLMQLRYNRWAVSFAVSPPLLPATQVHWVVTDKALRSVVFDEIFHTNLEVDSAGSLILQHANCSYFKVFPHHMYEVNVTVTRGDVKERASGLFVLRIPVNRGWDVKRVAPQLHFGFERHLKVLEETLHFSGLRDSLMSRHGATADYFGYWENKPLDDQPLPQTLRRVRHNPFTNETVLYPLFFGRNNVSFYVSDIDEVCDPILFEMQEFWAFQAILLQPPTSPTTMCSDDIPLKALTVRYVLAAMRFFHNLNVRFVGDASWEPQENLDVVEGHFECVKRGLRSAACHVVAGASGDGEPGGILQMHGRGVAELSWVLRLEVGDTALAPPESVDTAVARVISLYSDMDTGRKYINGADNDTVVVEVRSRAAVIVRRILTLPDSVNVTLPMSLRVLKVHPPQSQINQEKDVPHGRWIVKSPLRLLSVSDAFVAELDTSHVPNVQQTLQTGTLQFIAEDTGEAIDIGVPYTSRCPPRLVEYVVEVVSVAAEPIVPATMVIYTEDECVQLRAPRGRLKDENTQWDIPYCQGATQPLYITETNQQDLNGQQGEERTLDAIPEEVKVCGIEPHHWCDVIWTARNNIAAVSQVFSLRRCQRPPQLFFHKDGLQKSIEIPHVVYVLPSVEWFIGYAEGEEIDKSKGEELFTSPGYIARAVIPIAGYNATLGYTFNYTGSQQDFEMDVTFIHGAANQFGVTQQNFDRSAVEDKNDEIAAANIATPLGLRRFFQLNKDYNSYYNNTDESFDIDVNNSGVVFDENKAEVGGNLSSNLLDEDIQSHGVVMNRSNAGILITNSAKSRTLHISGLGDSSHYPISCFVGLSQNAPEFTEDTDEFAKRGMCVIRKNYFVIFSVAPLGVVPTAGSDVIQFCYPSFEFSRHPWLHTKYQFDFLWVCENTSVIFVERYTPTWTVLRHIGNDNETRCSLTVRNTLTETEQTDSFLLRRVYPTKLPQTFIALSHNVAEINCFVSNAYTHVGRGNTINITASHSDVEHEHKYRLKTRWIVGKRVILHVESDVKTDVAQWRAIRVIPEVPSPIGTQVLLEYIHFLPLVQYTRAIDLALKGASVLITGINVPGLYTFGFYHPDPVYPSTCPNVSVMETFHVVHAQVVQKEVTAYDNFVTIEAVPIPREIECEFVGQWEVVSVQTSVNETVIENLTLAGIRFENTSNPITLVRGLPFGIVTLRWAIYAVFSNISKVSVEEQEYLSQKRCIADFDTMQVLVLTENLQIERIVTLSDTVRISTTSSTLNWELREGNVTSGSLLSRGPQLHVESVLKGTHDIAGSGISDGIHEVVVVSRLPIGLTYLEYDLYSSPRLFGPMLLKKQQNVLKKQFIIERVSAFLSANTTLDHECDAYSGNGRISICLHAEGARDIGKVSSSLSDLSQSSLSLLGTRLVAPEKFEAVVKAGAEQFALAHGCSLPWWVNRTTRWFDIRADAARHCVSFGVAATRHMHPAEVSHFLFLAQARLGFPHLCSNGGNFMTGNIIEGALTWSESVAVAQEHIPRIDNILQFVPFLNSITLERDERSMRPMLSLLGVPDVVASELDISDYSEDGDDGDGVSVVFRLDTAQPRQMGGFADAPSPQRENLLAMCVSDTVRASDVLQFWTEVNRPDGAEGRTSKEWLEYVEAVREKHVPCEPLFSSLAYMLLRPDDTDATLRSRRAQFVPPKERRLVSIDVIGQQLIGLQRDYRWTCDGIDVTGLRAELQDALLRRRITKSQLMEIKEARSLRDVAHKNEGQQQNDSIIGDTWSNLTRKEQFEKVLRLYKGVLGEDVAAIRVRLPRYKPFSLPHNLFFRTVVHKNVICGANILQFDSVNSVMLFGRLELIDLPPMIGVTPAVIKQCEVEGGIPPINVNISGVVFVHPDSFTTADVLLEEVPNPNRTAAVESSTDVGLTPCLRQMQAGMRISISSETRKELVLRLSPCQSFQMLSQTDYNEHQNSELLLEKLLLPRLLRITLRNVLLGDSHTHGMRSVSFILEVQPTLARLHLRPLLSANVKKTSTTSASSSWLEPVSRRPLLMCEMDLRRSGVELGVQLIGDKWHFMVGEEDISDDNSDNYDYDATSEDDNSLHYFLATQQRHSSNSGNDGDKTDFLLQSAVNHKESASNILGTFSSRLGGRRRTPQNVALINSFSIVEHYSFDSAHHLLLRHGGLYRSHFLSHLFSVMRNKNNLLRHKFIHRYNDTFVGVRIPPEQRSSPDGFLFTGEDNVRPDTAFLPPIRLFSTIEEIIFAVPGIATECRGCLLADATYFIAGDLTGLWSFSPAMPRLELNNNVLVEPLRVPFYAAPHVPREWRFTPLCPVAVWNHLTDFWNYWKPLLSLRDDQPFLRMELVVYSLRDMLGGEVPLSKRPTVLLTSAPLLFKEVLTGEGQSSLHNITEMIFRVNDSAAKRAQTMMAADFSRYWRSHLHTTHDYIKVDQGAGGALAVNASVFLSVCVPPTVSVAEVQCSIVSFTNSLLIMEESRMTYYRQLRNGSLGSFLNPAALIHHAGSSLVLYIILLRLSTMRQVVIIGNTRMSASTRSGLAVVLFVAMLFFYVMVPTLWVVIWTLLWAILFSLVPDVIVGVYCVLHLLFWAFVM